MIPENTSWWALKSVDFVLARSQPLRIYLQHALHPEPCDTLHKQASSIKHLLIDSTNRVQL